MRFACVLSPKGWACANRLMLSCRYLRSACPGPCTVRCGSPCAGDDGGRSPCRRAGSQRDCERHLDMNGQLALDVHAMSVHHSTPPPWTQGSRSLQTHLQHVLCAK